MANTLTKRSFSLAGHRTSVALEPAFWEALQAEAGRRDTPLAALVAAVDAERTPANSLASSLRVAVLAWSGEHAMAAPIPVINV